MAEIQKAPSASAAAALAIEKLGVRNGPDFAAAVQEGRFAYGDLVNTITNGTDTIDSAAKDTEHFGEKFTMFVNRMKVAAEPLASGVFDAVGQAIDRMSPAFQEGIGGVTAFIAAFKAGGDDVTSAGFAGELEKLGLKARRAFDGALPGLQGFADAVSGLSSSVLPALKTAWEAAFGAVESTVKWIGEHQEILDAFKFEIGAGLVVAVYALASAMVPLIVSVYSLAAGVVAATWPFLLIGGAITAVVAGVIWAYRNLGFFRAAVDGVATAAMWLWGSVLVPVAGFLAGVLGPAFSFVAGLIGSFASNIGGWLGNIPGALGGVVEFFEGLPGVVIGFLGTLWTTISGWVVGVATTLPGLIAGWYMAFMQWVIDTIVNLPGQLAYLAGFIIGWIIGEAINLGIALVGWANAFGNWALGVIVAMPGWLANVAAALWGFMVYVVTELPAQLLGWYLAFANWVFSVAGSIGGWLVGVAAALWGWVMSTGAALPGQLFGWFMQFANWAGDLAGKLPGLLNRAADSILNWIRGIPGYVSGAVSSMIDIGKNIVNSLWDGVNSLKDWITDKVKKFASGLIDGIKSVLHIGSPSKDMIEIGKFMAQGLGVGFTGEASNLQHSIDGTMGGLKFDMKGATYARGALGNTVAGDFYTTHPGAPRGTDVASFAALARDMAANGGGMGPTHNWYVQGSIRSDQDLMALVRDELLKQGFSGTPVPTPAGV
jgi:phage-related protein